MSQRRLWELMGTIALVLVFGSSGLTTAKTPKILEFDTMVGVQGALVGSANPIRGINGGGIAWTLASGRGELAASGHLEIDVTSLVLAAGANAGNNPSATFRGLVSCLASDASVVKVLTDPFPATTCPGRCGGCDSHLE